MKITDEQIVSALLTTKSNAEAARSLGMSESQLYNRLRTNEVRSLMQDMQSNILSQVSAYVSSKLLKAAETISEIMEDPEQTPHCRIAAACALFKYAPQFSAFSWQLADHADDDRWKLRL